MLVPRNPLRVGPKHFAFCHVVPLIIIMVQPVFVDAAGGTARVATVGATVTQKGSWPEGVADFLNHPTRTNGWNSWFSEWPSDVEQYELHPTTMDEVNRLLARFAKIESENLQLILTPYEEPSGYGWVGRLPAGNATPIMFSLGDQSRIDQWYERLPEGKFGVMEFEQAPVAVPPSLTLFVGHKLIDLDQLVIPPRIQVRSGNLPTLFDKSHTKQERLDAESPQPRKTTTPVKPEIPRRTEAINEFIRRRQIKND